MWSSQTVSKMSRPTDVLTSIVEHKRQEIDVARKTVSIAEFTEHIQSHGPKRGFENRLREHMASGRSGIIAECKKASPSKGVIRRDYDVAQIAGSYEGGGASCLSVLTDQKFFQGSADHLEKAKKTCNLPVLRKDFIIDKSQILESHVMGADCILLIVAILDLAELQDFAAQAVEFNMDVLVEVHSEAELELALQVSHGMLGINNRNLRTFETTLETSIRLSRLVPKDRLVIAESGIHSAEDIETLKSAGINAFLIGESFMRASDPGTELERIFQAERLTYESGAVLR